MTIVHNNKNKVPTQNNSTVNANGNAGACRTEITEKHIIIYDNNGNMRIRLGIC